MSKSYNIIIKIGIALKNMVVLNYSSDLRSLG